MMNEFAAVFFDAWRYHMANGHWVVLSTADQRQDDVERSSLDLFVRYRSPHETGLHHGAQYVEKLFIHWVNTHNPGLCLVSYLSLFADDTFGLGQWSAFEPITVSRWQARTLLQWLKGKVEASYASHLLGIATDFRQLAASFQQYAGNAASAHLAVAPSVMPQFLAMMARLYGFFGGNLYVYRHHAAFLQATSIFALQWDDTVNDLAPTRVRALLLGPQVPIAATPESLLADLSRFHLPAGLEVFKIDQQLLDLLPQSFREGASLQSVPLPPDAIPDLVITALRKIRVTDRSINMRSGQADARLEGYEENGYPVRKRGSIEIAWPVDQPELTQTPVLFSLVPANAATAIEFGNTLVAEASRKRVVAALPRTVVVGPGEAMPREASGVVLDYTALARRGDVPDLKTGFLSVGKWAFQKPDAAVQYGPRIFIDEEPACRGVLVCAPPGTGKTHLLVQWALEARAQGYHVFIIDVKGTLLKLYPLDPGDGSVFQFTTEPGAARDRINFLGDLLWSPPRPGGEKNYMVTKHNYSERRQARIDEIIAAFLPKPEEKSEDYKFYELRKKWLFAFIELLMLEAYYFKERYAHRRPDLVDLYELVTNEKRFHALAKALVQKHRSSQPAADAPIDPPDHWLVELQALLLSDDEVLKEFAQGRSSDPFGVLTSILSNFLRPFARQLSGSVRDIGGEGRLFRLEDVFAPSDHPKTVIFAARVQDTGPATALLGMAVRRIENLVDARMNQTRKSRLVLLFDEAARIPGLDPNHWVSFPREAGAAFVFAYQRLTDIGTPEDTVDLLGGIGAQVYLGGLEANTSQLFTKAMPRRRRIKPMPATFSHSSQGGQTSSQAKEEEVALLEAAELSPLPGGKRPGLVVIRQCDGTLRRPIVVDLSTDGSGPGQATVGHTRRTHS